MQFSSKYLITHICDNPSADHHPRASQYCFCTIFCTLVILFGIIFLL
ncbi:MAG: hypothetical protein Q8S84_09395 [bacterium]|nr:hypothetical protein [bacterium]MDP3381633.1 hypothetical protein [bacterium]